MVVFIFLIHQFASRDSFTVCEFGSFYTGAPEANLVIAERCVRRAPQTFSDRE
jgi:hypothetical protein